MRLRWAVCIVSALALVSAACGDDSGTETTAPTPAPAAAIPEPAAATPETVRRPGAGAPVSLARANWDTGYFQAAVYKTLLEELGYSVTDPSAAELIPAEFYPALAEGKYDLWVNGWFPLHDEFLAGELPSGSLVGDNVQKIGAEMPAGGLQGFVIDVATAMKYGITMLDDIGNDPAIAALFDTDGDGKSDITGCNEGWGCQITINDTIEFNGWSDTIEQKSGDYPALWAEVVVHAGRESRFWRTRGRRAPTSRSSSLGRM